MIENDLVKEYTVDIANLSFTIATVEEVGMAKIFTKQPYGHIPDAYSVSWSEWIKNSEGEKLQVEASPKTYKVKKFQKFETYEDARLFFIKKVDGISLLYKEDNGTKK